MIIRFTVWGDDDFFGPTYRLDDVHLICVV